MSSGLAGAAHIAAVSASFSRVEPMARPWSCSLGHRAGSRACASSGSAASTISRASAGTCTTTPPSACTTEARPETVTTHGSVRLPSRRVTTRRRDYRAGRQPLPGAIRPAPLSHRLPPFGGKGWRFHLSAAVMRSAFRGWISLNPDMPPDPAAPPVIDTSYFSDPDDVRPGGPRSTPACSAATSACNRAMMRSSGVGPQAGPKPSRTRATSAPDSRAHATHDYHPAGTCKMGPASDPAPSSTPPAASTAWTRLLVVDAAIMPFVTLANTNLPTFVGAEKIARAPAGTGVMGDGLLDGGGKWVDG